MRGRWGGSRGSFKFFIQKFYDKINLSSFKTVTAKADYLDDTKKVEDIQYTDFGGIHTLDSTVQFSKDIVAVPSAAIFTGLNEHTWTVPATATYRAYVCGGGGAGASGSGGHGGLFYADIPLVAGETLNIGVGAGGKATGFIGNSGTYAMRGGTGGSGSIAGAGGGGSYVAFGSSPGSRPFDTNTWSGPGALTLAAGGGGGSADHGFTANFGGHGFGVGGTSYSANYANSSQGGKNGSFGYGASPGAGGPTVASNGGVGGSANINGNAIGGNGGVTTQSGGGGGGGAGGGGGGAAGQANGSSGGTLDLNSTMTVNTFSTETRAGGGGGGGGHGSNCGGTGGGGGVLLYTAYNNSWSTVQGSGIPYFNSASISSSSMDQYSAYSQFNTDCTTYLSATGFGGVVASSAGSRGGGSANGSHGFVAIIPLQATTYTTYT